MDNKEILDLYLNAYVSKKAADMDYLKDKARYKKDVTSKSGPYYDKVKILNLLKSQRRDLC